jgi:hypothetical protein
MRFAIAACLFLSGALTLPSAIPAAVQSTASRQCGTDSPFIDSAYAIIAADRSGNVFLAKRPKTTVFKIAPDGKLTTVVANSGPVAALAADAAGNLYIADTGNPRVRKVTPGGVNTIVAGSGRAEFSGDGGPAVSASLCFPTGLSVDGAGNLFVSSGPGSGIDSLLEGDYRVRKISAAGIITTVAGTGAAPPPSLSLNYADSERATAKPTYPRAIAADAKGNLFLTDGRVVYQARPSGIVTRVAGRALTFSDQPADPKDGGPALSAALFSLRSVAIDDSGNLFVWDGRLDRLRKVTPAGVLTTIAGNGKAGFGEDGVPAITSPFAVSDGFSPHGSVIASDGTNIFLVEARENSTPDRGVAPAQRVYTTRIRRISPDGKVSTVATIP